MRPLIIGEFHDAGCGLTGKDQKGGVGKGMVAAPPSFAVAGGVPGKKVSWTVSAHRKAPEKAPPLFVRFVRANRTTHYAP